MFHDLLKNKTALLIMGGALVLIIGLVLTAMLLGNGGRLTGGGTSGGGGYSGVVVNVQVPATPTPPEPTPTPTEPASTPEPQPTATPSLTITQTYENQSIGFSINLYDTDWAVDETDVEDGIVYLSVRGYRAAMVARHDFTMREFLDNHRLEFINAMMEASGAQETGAVRLDEQRTVASYPCAYYYFELIKDGAPFIAAHTYIVDAPGGAFLLAYYEQLPDADEHEIAVATATFSSFTVLGTAPQTTPPAGEYDTYVNQKYGFSVQYPGNPRIEEESGENTIYFVYDKNYDVSINVALFKNTSMEQFKTEGHRKVMRDYKESYIKHEWDEPLTRGAHEYYAFRYSIQFDDDFAYERIGVVHANDLYVISWMCPVAHEGDMSTAADLFMATLTFLN